MTHYHSASETQSMYFRNTIPQRECARFLLVFSLSFDFLVTLIQFSLVATIWEGLQCTVYVRFPSIQDPTTFLPNSTPGLSLYRGREPLSTRIAYVTRTAGDENRLIIFIILYILGHRRCRYELHNHSVWYSKRF